MEMIKSLLCKGKSVVLLLIRLTLGVIFIQSGTGKLTHMSQTVEFFTSIKIPFPEINAAIAAGAELAGGTLILLGLFTQLAVIPLTIVMIVAILTAKIWDVAGLDDFIRLQELDYILFFLLLLCTGAGKWSLDRVFFKKDKSKCCAPGTVAKV